MLETETKTETNYDIEINLEINFSKRIEVFDEYDLIPCLFTCTDPKNNLFLNLLINEEKLEIKQKQKQKQKEEQKQKQKEEQEQEQEQEQGQGQLINQERNQERISKPDFNFYREYLCLRISEERLVKAKNRLITLRDIFINPEDNFILKVRLNEDFNVMKTKIISDLNTIENKDLPEEKLFLLED